MAKGILTSSLQERTTLKRRKIEDDDDLSISPAKKARTRVRYPPVLSFMRTEFIPFCQLFMRRMPSAQAKSSSEFIYSRSHHHTHHIFQCDRQIPCSHVCSVLLLRHFRVTDQRF